MVFVRNKSGFSLIETMVAMVLLMIIVLSSAYFFTIPPFRREALRFAALERAAGMLDLISVYGTFAALSDGYYDVNDDGAVPETSDNSLLGMTFANQLPSMWYTCRLYSVGADIVSPTGTIREVEIRLYDEKATSAQFASLKMLVPF